MTAKVPTDLTERKYALSRVATGDYLLPSNDAKNVYRIRSYTDGPSFGLDEWPRDRTLWGVWRWTGEVRPGCFVDTDPMSERWEEVAIMFETRRAAIAEALSR